MGRGGLLNGHVVNGCPFIRLWISVGTESGGQISKCQRPIELPLGSVWILLSSNQAVAPSPLWPAVVNSETPPHSSGHVVQTQSYFSNFFFLLFWHIGSFLTHFPDSLQQEVFMWLNCTCLNLRLSCFLVDLLDFLTQSSLRYEFRDNINIQNIKTAVQIFASSNTLSELKEAPDGPAG